jgi:hypothetical protein
MLQDSESPTERRPASRSRFGDEFTLTFLTDDPQKAGWAASAGVDRIGPDLERVGKSQRQSGLNTRLSGHELSCLGTLSREVGSAATLFARVNPINAGSPGEIERILGAGCRALMLPYFHSVAEVDRFVRLVAGRAKRVLLVETAAAAVLLDDILARPGIDEVHIGLTDMMISTRVDSRFRLLTSWFIAGVANRVHEHRKPLALAGLARADDSALPIPPALVFPQYVRIGARGAFLTRAFTNGIESETSFRSAVRSLRQALNDWGEASASSLEKARLDLIRRVDAMADSGTPPP